MNKGRNILHFSRETGEIKGLTIRDFTLTPLKGLSTDPTPP